MKQNINSIENSVDPDQLASKKPADQDPHCFPRDNSGRVPVLIGP